MNTLRVVGILLELVLPLCLLVTVATLLVRRGGLHRHRRPPRWSKGPVEWVVLTLHYESVRPDPYDDMPESLDDDFHHALEDDAISPGSDPDAWIGIVESFRGEDGTLEISCMGPDADRMWAALEPVVRAARGLWYDGTVEITYRDGRPTGARSLSE